MDFGKDGSEKFDDVTEFAGLGIPLRFPALRSSAVSIPLRFI